MEAMPTTVSQPEIDELVRLVNDYRGRTGVSISELSRRAEVRRAMLSELLSGTYRHSPTFDLVSRIAQACEIRIRFSPSDR